jgi:DNA-binding MarR family transcriptional regulator
MNAELLTVWHGARWREYPQPVIADGTLVASSAITRPERVKRVNSQQAQVLAVIGAQWVTVKDITRLSGLPPKAVSEYVRRGVQRGILDRVRESQGRRTGGARWVYRRRQG